MTQAAALEVFSLAYCRTCLPRCSVAASRGENGNFRVVSHELRLGIIHTDLKVIRIINIFLDPGETPAQQLSRMDALYSGRYV